MKNDCRDWFVMILVAAVLAAATVFLFQHGDHENFITWAGVVTTVTGVFHWMTVRDAKLPDAAP